MNTTIADTIIFLHLPKTAGTTLNHIIRRQYDPEQLFLFKADHLESLRTYLSLPQEKKRELRLVSGHIPYGFHEYVPGTSTYFTFLRDPIKRVVSFYNYVKDSNPHYLHGTVMDRSMDLKAFVQEGITQMVDNGQVRFVSGEWLNPGFGACTAEMLQTAKDNLRANFSVVGLTERFDETLLLLRAAYDWQHIQYVRQNVTRYKPQAKIISEEERELISHYNQLDIALYEYAQSLFAEQIAAMGPGFPEELQNFQRKNQSLSTLARRRFNDAMGQMRKISVRAYLHKMFS